MPFRYGYSISDRSGEIQDQFGKIGAAISQKRREAPAKAIPAGDKISPAVRRFPGRGRTVFASGALLIHERTRLFNRQFNDTFLL